MPVHLRTCRPCPFFFARQFKRGCARGFSLGTGATIFQAPPLPSPDHTHKGGGKFLSRPALRVWLALRASLAGPRGPTRVEIAGNHRNQKSRSLAKMGVFYRLRMRIANKRASFTNCACASSITGRVLPIAHARY